MKKLMTKKELLVVLDVSEASFYRLEKKGLLPPCILEAEVGGTEAIVFALRLRGLAARCNRGGLVCLHSGEPMTTGQICTYMGYTPQIVQRSLELTTRQTHDLIAFVDDKEKLIDVLRAEAKTSSLDEQWDLLKCLTEQLKVAVDKEAEFVERIGGADGIFDVKNDRTSYQQRQAEIETQNATDESRQHHHHEHKQENQHQQDQLASVSL